MYQFLCLLHAAELSLLLLSFVQTIPRALLKLKPSHVVSCHWCSCLVVAWHLPCILLDAPHRHQLIASCKQCQVCFHANLICWDSDDLKRVSCTSYMMLLSLQISELIAYSLTAEKLFEKLRSSLICHCCYQTLLSSKKHTEYPNNSPDGYTTHWDFLLE